MHEATHPAALASHLYAAHDVGSPGFRENKRGALHMRAGAHNAGFYFLCVKSAYFEDSSLLGTQPDGTPDVAFGSLVRIVGPLARLQMVQMTGNCSFPAHAAPRTVPSAIAMSWRMARPLFAVSDGAVVDIDRTSSGTIPPTRCSPPISVSRERRRVVRYNTIVLPNLAGTM